MPASMLTKRIISGQDKMKSVILNGSFKDDHRLDIAVVTFAEALKQMGWTAETVNLGEKNIAGCLACDACWYKTPGTCAINDDGREIAGKIIQSDLTVFLSPVAFGQYSSEMKKALDRTKPLLSPLMKANSGRLGHVPRYSRYPKIVTVGLLSTTDSDSEKLFKDLACRNSHTLHAPAYASGIVYSNQDEASIHQLAVELFNKAGIQ